LAGARVAQNVAELVRECQTVLICVADYDVSNDIMEPVLDSSHFQHKTVIELSTGTPTDAAAHAVRYASAGAYYLDGAIMSTPTQMGSSEAVILIAGDEDVFGHHREMLKVLAPDTIYKGTKESLAAAWDIALLSYFFSALIGATHAARIAAAEGIPIAELGATIKAWSTTVGSIIKESIDVIATGEFGGGESTVRTCYISSELILRHAKQSGTSTTFPRFAFEVFETAMKSGLADEDGVAIFKTL
jgi:3-hydroxyisobutyrate dehydrogenase-like beta-hydroxyacid dehydrogenase